MYTQILIQKDSHITLGEKWKLQKSKHGMYLLKLIFKTKCMHMQKHIKNFQDVQTQVINSGNQRVKLIREFYFSLVCTLLYCLPLNKMTKYFPTVGF